VLLIAWSECVAWPCAILLTSLPCDPATAKRTRGKGAAGLPAAGVQRRPLRRVQRKR